AREDRRRLARDHLERRNHQQQASYDREPRRDRDQRDEEHDDSEGALVQAVHEPTQREMVSWHLIVKPLQNDGGSNKQSGPARGPGYQKPSPNSLSHLVGISAPSRMM